MIIVALGQRGAACTGWHSGIGHGNGGRKKSLNLAPGMHPRGVKAAAASATFFSLFTFSLPNIQLGERDFSYLSKKGHGR
jgi:hypothetical protein